MPQPQLRRACACGGACSKCQAEHPDEEQGRLQAKSVNACDSGLTQAPPIVHEVLSSAGQPLDPAARSFLEPRFGHDFSRVRVHTSDRASHSAQKVNALAYTVGNNIVFAGGHYQPGNPSGQRLLAHELAHVVQQQGSGTSIQRQIPIGAVSDPAEREADQIADAVLSNSPTIPSAKATAGTALRRVPTLPQKRDETRSATIDLSANDKVDVTRSFHSCFCSKVADKRTGIFYNPKLDNLAIAYKYCSGSTTFEAYLKTATDFSSGNAPPQGTAQLGIDVNVWGQNVQGRLIVEGVATNQGSGPAVGGHAKIVFQGGKWQVILEPQFLRQLAGLAPGANPNQLEVNLGARYGKYSVEIKGTDLLSKTRDITGAACYAISDDIRICGTLGVQGSATGGPPGVTPGIELRVPFGEGAKKEECYQCVCPPPVKKFTCVERHHKDAVPPPPVPQERRSELRYYFKYWDTADSEDPNLRAASAQNMSDMTTLIGRGYHITSITAFASPEGGERKINDPLAMKRAKKTVEIVRGRVGTSTSIPEPAIGRSELLGRNPAGPSTHLRDAIAASGLHSAEEVTPLLTGSEILPAQMTPEFLDLFKRTEPDEWMQLFGLDTGAALRPDVEAAVRAFIAANGKGPRPWENVFRLLRFGAVKLTGTEMVPDKKTPSKPAENTSEEVKGADCDEYGKKAESQNLLGPIDPDALRPSKDDTSASGGCRKESDDGVQADIKAGCDYTLPADLAGKSVLTAPDYAPQRLEEKK